MLTPRRVGHAILAVMALFGLIDGYFAAHRLPLPRPVDFAFMLAITPLPYLWYFVDATARSFRRTTALGGAVVAFNMLAVPYYLVRSRPKGTRAGAVLRFLGFVVLCVVVQVAGDAAALLVF